MMPLSAAPARRPGREGLVLGIPGSPAGESGGGGVTDNLKGGRRTAGARAGGGVAADSVGWTGRVPVRLRARVENLKAVQTKN